MRIADKMQYEQVNTNIGKNRSTMQELQGQAATQKRVTKPSDDPLAAARVLANRIDLQGNRQYHKNLGYAKTFLEFTDQSLNDLSETLMRAKELAIGQANDGSASAETRAAVGTEVAQLFNQAIAIGNRKLGDRFLFSGFKTQTASFTPDGKYQGDPGEMNLHIDKEVFLPMNVPGQRVFLGIGIDRNGGMVPHAPQARTLEQLQEQLSAEKPGSFLDQMPAARKQQQEREQQAAAMRGPASVGGMTTPNAPTGSFSTSINSEEQLPSGVDIFLTLRTLETALKTNDKGGIQATLNDLDDALSQVILTRAQVGSRGMAVDNYIATMDKQKVENQIAISQLEDADIFATVSDINKTENTLQATLQTSGKLIDKSLLDFIR